jgi:hypothetical protein
MRAVAGMAMAGAAVVGLPDVALANQVFVFAPGTSVGAGNGQTPGDHVVQVYIENKVGSFGCARVELAYTGSSGWVEAHKDCTYGDGGTSRNFPIGGQSTAFIRACDVGCGAPEIVTD